MNILKYCKAGYHTIKLMLKPDDNIRSLIYLGDQIAQSSASLDAIDALFENEILEDMYQSRTGLEQMELTKLKELHRSTFGNHVYRFYTSRKLDVYPMKTDLNFGKEIYISERIRKTHDFLHVLLDYDTDLVGEAKVNAFVANQTKMPMSFLILCGIIIKYFFTKPLQFRILIDGIIEGWSTGYKFHSFLIQDWDELLLLTTNDVRDTMMKITRKEVNFSSRKLSVKVAT